MYNWNIDTTTLREDPEAYTIWKLEQMINYGLDGGKLERRLLEKYWDRLRIDPKRRATLAFFLWGKQS
jgi:hypothetical protein